MKILFLFLLLSAPLVSNSSWVEEQLEQMTLREKIGQLFMIPVWPEQGKQQLLVAERAILDHRVGGICWYSGNPVAQVEWINHCQLLSQTPLLMAQDLEWGLAMRLTNTADLPRATTLGALPSTDLVAEMGREVGRQSRLVGVHLVLAPVVDLNTNPRNPVIGMRSFGTDPAHVSEWAAAFHSGLVDAGVLGCAKHFPGHGDTEVDSHLALPTLTIDRELFERRELAPFKRMVEEGVAVVMVGHLAFPAVDGAEGRPASRSPEIIEGVLREQLGYDGVVITDALDMGGASGDAGEIAVEAVEAGVDLLLMPTDLRASVLALASAVESGRVSEERITESARRVLLLKEKMGLHRGLPTVAPLRIRDLHTAQMREMRAQIYREAVVCFGEPAPLHHPTALVQVGCEGATPLSEAVGLEPVSFEEVGEVHTVLVALFGSDLPSDLPEKLEKLGDKQVVILLFGSPYGFDPGSQCSALLIGFEEAPDAQRAVADLLLGNLVDEGGKLDWARESWGIWKEEREDKQPYIGEQMATLSPDSASDCSIAR